MRESHSWSEGTRNNDKHVRTLAFDAINSRWGVSYCVVLLCERKVFMQGRSGREGRGREGRGEGWGEGWEAGREREGFKGRSN